MTLLQSLHSVDILRHGGTSQGPCVVLLHAVCMIFSLQRTMSGRGVVSQLTCSQRVGGGCSSLAHFPPVTSTHSTVEMLPNSKASWDNLGILSWCGSLGSGGLSRGRREEKECLEVVIYWRTSGVPLVFISNPSVCSSLHLLGPYSLFR